MNLKFARILALMLALMLALSTFALAEEVGETPAENQVIEQDEQNNPSPENFGAVEPDGNAGEAEGPGENGNTGDATDTVEAEDVVVAAVAADAIVAVVEDELVAEEIAVYEAELVEDTDETDPRYRGRGGRKLS